MIKSRIRRDAIAAQADPFYSFVQLLLLMDGPNGSTVFPDLSPVPKTVTAYGNAKILKAQSRFGGASAYFDGSGDYLGTPDSAAWNFASGNFTIEFWAKSLDKGGASAGIVIGQAANLAAGTASWAVAVNGTTLYFLASTGIGSWNIANVSGTRQVTSDWAHYAVERSGAALQLFENGISLNSGSIGTVSDCAQSLIVGDGTSNQNPIVGYLDSLRVTRGIARYTGNFVPPMDPFFLE